MKTTFGKFKPSIQTTDNFTKGHYVVLKSAKYA